MTRTENMQAATFDHAALLAAFEAVKDNHGCAGVDGVTIKLFEQNLSVNLIRLRTELNERTYFPLPLMKIQVAKKNGEPARSMHSHGAGPGGPDRGAAPRQSAF